MSHGPGKEAQQSRAIDDHEAENLYIPMGWRCLTATAPSTAQPLPAGVESRHGVPVNTTPRFSGQQLVATDLAERDEALDITASLGSAQPVLNVTGGTRTISTPPTKTSMNPMMTFRVDPGIMY